MAVTVVGYHTRHQVVGTSVSIAAITDPNVALHGHLYLANDNLKIFIGNRDGTVKQIGDVVGGSITASTALQLTTAVVEKGKELNFTWAGAVTDFVRGDGSFVPLSGVVSEPTNQVVYGTGSGVDSSADLIFDPVDSVLTIGTRIDTGSALRCLMVGLNNQVGGSYNIIGGASNVVSGAYNFCIGLSNTVTAQRSLTSGESNTNGGYWSFITGYGNTLSASNSSILGRAGNITHSGNIMLLDNSVTTKNSSAVNAFTAVFVGGYRFMKDATNQVLGIAATTGYVTINNIPTHTSDNLLISNAGVVSTRTVASLSIPTVTPSALTTSSTNNVTFTLTGTPATALLQAVNIQSVWTGELSVTRGGTGASAFTAGYLKADAGNPFTTVATIPYSDITGGPTAYTDEMAQDAVGTILSGDFAYDDTTPAIALSTSMKANIEEDSKSITVPYPVGNAEEYTMFHTKAEMTVTSIVCVVAGTSPSIDYNVYFSGTRDDATPTNINSAEVTVTSTSGVTNTTFANATINAGSFVWIELKDKTGTVTEFHMTINYTKGSIPL